MYKNYLLLSFLFFMFLSTNGQNTLTLQPSATAGKDAFISSNVLTQGQGNSPEFNAATWTIFGSPLSIRALIDFDLSSLPAGATIQSATLTLYNNPNSVNGNANGQHSGSNEAVLQRITTPWTEDVAWNNQPSTTTQNEVTLLESTNPNQDYVLNVTNLLLDNIANPNSGFGFLLKLKNETPFKILAFASSDHPNPALHPKLEITYTCNLLSLQPSATAGKDAFISSNVLTQGQGNSPEFNAATWTIFGSPLSIRALIDFDLSSLPAGATIQSATLTLYNNPNSVNGSANGQHSGSNEAVLQRITSPWTEDVAWNNQPSTTTQNEVTLLESTNPNQDYVLNVTNLLLDNIANPNSGFGFLLKLKNETPFKILAFASSDHPNPALHPKLEICYNTALTTNDTAHQNNTISLYPNPSSGVVNIDFKMHNDIASIATFVVFDTTGKKVFEDKQFTKDILSYPVNNLPNGVYYWMVTADQITSKGKLIIIK